MIAAGLAPAAGELRADVEHPERMWAQRRAWDLVKGMRFLDEGGQVRVVAAKPERVVRGLLAVPVRAAVRPAGVVVDVEPELVFVPAARLVKTRTPGEQRLYLDARDVYAAGAAARRGEG